MQNRLVNNKSLAQGPNVSPAWDLAGLTVTDHIGFYGNLAPTDVTDPTLSIDISLEGNWGTPAEDPGDNNWVPNEAGVVWTGGRLSRDGTPSQPFIKYRTTTEYPKQLRIRAVASRVTAKMDVDVEVV